MLLLYLDLPVNTVLKYCCRQEMNLKGTDYANIYMSLKDKKKSVENE